VAAAREDHERAAKVVRRLARYYEITDLQLASALNVSRQTLNSWVNGRSRMPDEIEAGLAVFFGVPRDVLYRTPDDALRWVLDHPLDPGGAVHQGMTRKPCSAPVAA
jgi:transcriptional regulator with XRE-family HTH domain